jgi:ATP-binding cassette subfamily B protein
MATDRIDLYALAWHTSQLPIVLELLARKRNLLPQTGITAPTSRASANGDALKQWMDDAAGALGIEIEPVAIAYAEVDEFGRGSSPALLQLPNQNGDAPRFLAILKEGWRDISIVRPDLEVQRIRFEQIRDTLCHALEASTLQETEQLLALSGTPREHWARARRAMTREALIRRGLGSSRVGNGWILRLSPGANLWRQARHERLWGLLLRYLGINAAQKGLELGAWVILGASALAGRFALSPSFLGINSVEGWGWLFAWALLLLTAAALRMPAQHARGAIRRKIMGVKAWLTYSALKLDPDKIRHQGAGQFLASIMASSTMEDRIGNGSVMIFVSLVELSVFTALLAFGAGGWLHAALLVVWTAVTLLMGWRYWRNGQVWNATYHQMTSDLAERMVGHRTRLAQEDRQRWHTDEDAILANYLEQSEELDRIQVQLKALVARGWMVVGLAGLAYPFIAAQPTQAQLLISLGGVLLASQSLNSLADDMLTLITGMLAWQQVESLVQAAAGEREHIAPPKPPAPAPDGQARPERSERVPVLMARNLVFRYRERARPILRECNLKIQEGDRLLLEGPSGGGKSTLAALLAGLRKPESGLLLWKSLDRQTVGADEWRRKVVVVPQFHENHIFTETFAFNLLMGRRWPPLPQDLEMAEAICRELGLGDLLDRMPAGLEQPIGESGWHLSHGEASRLYIARALLQDADLVILDETFGTLDPENLQRAMRCVLNRAPTLLVIAHP